ncbi:response regulator aspartate phosphatase [Bacillus velezensis]
MPSLCRTKENQDILLYFNLINSRYKLLMEEL